MKRTVLLVTPNLELGKLIGESLSETYQFDVNHCRDGLSALAFLREHADCGHVLIETALGESRVIGLGRALRRIKSTIKLILISRSQPSADVDKIRPWSLLRQPFVLPELLAALDAVPPTIIDADSIAAPVTPRLSWLEDPAVAVRTLQNLAAAPNIEGVILLRKHDVWAFAGNLSPAAVNKIRSVVLSNLNSEQEFDLLRYMRLEGRDDQHGLWAKLVIVNVILAVIYDLTTSFSEMRTQTNMLADALARPVLSPIPAAPELSLAANIQARRARWRRARTLALSASTDRRGPEFVSPLQPKHDFVEPLRLQGPRFAANELSEEESDPATRMARLTSVARPSSTKLDALTRGSASRAADPQGFSRGITVSPTPIKSQSLMVPQADSFDGNSIPYSCLLTPRFATHPLTGDLAALMRSTMPQVCTAYGWWLEFMEVTADCLHWVAVLRPTETVADHIHKIRHITSVQIWEINPEYLRENFSKDFWAPGYSILAGNQRHSRQQIQAYVLKYRGGQFRYGNGPSLDFDSPARENLD